MIAWKAMRLLGTDDQHARSKSLIVGCGTVRFMVAGAREALDVAHVSHTRWLRTNRKLTLGTTLVVFRSIEAALQQRFTM